MKQHAVNSLDNFICGWYLDNDTLCDNLIEYHKSQPRVNGETIGGYQPEVKNSFDCMLKDPELAKQYYESLQLCVNEYIKTYPWCDQYAAWGVMQDANIQQYEPNGAFYKWHTERINAQIPSVSRHLVFMTYLNDITDDGETEFLHQKIKVKPEKGLTLMWPADWTFTHRGVPSPTQEKYIITGWFNFLV
jgi:hypothetical protein